MKVIIALVILIAMNACSAQAMKKWLCCKNDTMYEPRWDVSCASTTSRRLQGMVEHYCPKKLVVASQRILQGVVHPVSPACTNFNASRRLQGMVTYKCPVNIEGVQCFKNNTNTKCVQPA